ncbi:hypothetical protein [Paenibacillus macerans]|uniref:hypothetical protein n=1 Tax=Paenibacillus macerans TaxID=44252 RepID=UPI003D3141B2
MKIKINLREICPYYKTDIWVEVEEELASEIRKLDLFENAYILRRYRNRAYFSLDREDGIEQEVQDSSISSEELVMQKISNEELYAALCSIAGQMGSTNLCALCVGHEQGSDSAGGKDG